MFVSAKNPLQDARKLDFDRKQSVNTSIKFDYIVSFCDLANKMLILNRSQLRANIK